MLIASILGASSTFGQAIVADGTAGSAVTDAEVAEPLVAEPQQQPQSQIAPEFEPVVVDVSPLTATGYRFQPQQVDVPALTATGYRFQPQQVDVPALTATGYRFQAQQVDVPTLTATGYAGALQPQPSDPQVADIQDTQPTVMEPAGPSGAGVFGGTHSGEPEGGAVGGPVDHPEAAEPALFVPVQIDTDTLRLTGIGVGKPPGEPEGPLGTNPFDFQDVRADVTAAKTPRLSGRSHPAQTLAPDPPRPCR